LVTRTSIDLQKIGDASDEIFCVLIGDHVEPRRDFIEKHALDVRDLDI
jgi:DNA gyrase subunit B